MKKILLLFAVGMMSLSGMSQAIIFSTVPSSAPTTTTVRMPQGLPSQTTLRGHYIIPAAEMAGIVSGTQFVGLGFVCTAGASGPSSGNMILYLENTTNTTNVKSTTWTTAIATMTQTYNGIYTNPVGTATPANINLTLQAPFTYTGGGIYVAYEYIGSTFTTPTPVTYAANSSLANSLYMNSTTSGTTPPPTVSTVTSFRPQARFFYPNPVANDLLVENLKVPRGYDNKLYAPTNSVSALVKNVSNASKSNIVASIEITGANPYTGSINIPTLGAGDTTTVRFTGLSLTNLGAQHIKVSIPPDDNLANNTVETNQTVSCDTLGYTGNVIPDDAIGFGTSSGIIAVRYTSPGVATSVKGIQVNIGNGAGNVGNPVKGVLLNAAGAILATSPELIVTNTHLGKNVYFEFPTPINIPAGTTFYVGTSQAASASNFYPVSSAYPENTPINMYYSFAVTGGSSVNYNTLGNFMISAVLSPVTTLTASVTGAMCQGTSVNYTASGAFGSFDFSVNAASAQNSAANLFSYAPANNNVISVQSTLNGCVANATVVAAIVNPLPVVTATTTAATICEGTSTTMNASGAVSYVWTPGNLSGASQTVSPTANTIYTVTGTGANGCTNTATVDIRVNSAPVVTATTTVAEICTGGSTTISAGDASTYVWMPGNLTGASQTVSPTANTTYTVTGTDGNGCTNTATVAITVNPLPVVTATTTDVEICEGASATISAGGASTYVWVPGNLTGASQTVSPTGNTTYIVTGTDVFGCTNTASVAIFVNPLPVVTATATDATICEGESTTINAGGATTYVWTPGNLSGASQTVMPTTNTTYTVTGTDANGCTNTATVAIAVNSAPVVTATTTAAAICTGGSTTINAGGASTYVWMPGNLTGASQTVSPTANTTYTVTGTDVNGCTNTATVAITVNPLPVVTATTADAAICTGESTTISAGGASTYVWAPGNLIGANQTVTPTGNTTYIVTGTDVNGCINTAAVAIAVNPIPVVTATTTAATVCQNGPTTINASGASTYIWMPGNLAGASQTVTPAANTTYTVTGTDANGCTNTATIAIAVNPAPVVTATTTAVAICAGASTTINASGANTYVWTPGNLVGASQTVTPTVTTTYTVTGTGANGCTNTATVAITVNPLPVNTVTQNGMTLTAVQTNATYKWVDCNNANAPIPGATSQSYTPTANGSYAVVITTASGCSSTSVCKVINTIGVAENSYQALSVFPNPGNGVYTLKSEQNFENVTFSVYSYSGQLLFEQTVAAGNTATIDLSLQAAGVYFLKMKDSDAASIKLIKQ